MASRPARLRPTLNVKMDLEGAPDVKRRRLGNVTGMNGNNNGTTTRSGNGPRTRGMMEVNLNCGNDLEESRVPADDGNIADAEVDAERRDSSLDSSSSESSESSDSDESSGKI